MGGDCGIRNKWFIEALKMKCFKRCNHANMYPWIRRPFVAVEDALTRIHNFYRGSVVDFTLPHLYQIFIKFAKERASEGASVIVISMDDSSNVPVEKKEEEEERDSSKEKQFPAYAVTTIFDNETIYNFGSIMASDRLLRVQIWDYFVEQMKQDEHLPRCTLIVEYKKEYVHLFHNGAYVGQTEEFAHNHGETDKSIWYWVGLFSYRGLPTVAYTSDSDQMAISGLFLTATYPENIPRNGAKIYWMYDMREGKYCEMREYVREVEDRLQVRFTEFAVFFILCGTDFFRKKRIAHFFSYDKIWDVFSRSTFRPCTTALLDQELTFDVYIELFVQQLYSRHTEKYWQKTVQGVNRVPKQLSVSVVTPVTIVQACKYDTQLCTSAMEYGTQYKFPTEEDKQVAVTRLKFNYNYWLDTHAYRTGEKQSVLRSLIGEVVVGVDPYVEPKKRHAIEENNSAESSSAHKKQKIA